MRTKRFTLVALAAFSCTPSEPRTPPPSSVVTAVFDPSKSQIPLPNDLLLQQDPATLNVPPAQAELVAAFIAQHGFPNDQEVPVTIDFERSVIDPQTGAVTKVAPQLDLSTLTSSTVIAFRIAPDGTEGAIELDPVQPADYVNKDSHGELTLHHRGRQPWAPGEIVVMIRGGVYGVHTVEKDPIYSSQVFYLLLQGQDLTKQQNIGLLAAQLGSFKAAQAAAMQLNQIVKLYQATVYPIADQHFPHEELAAATTFTIAPLVTQVELDPGRGLVPLPIDLLRDQKPGGTLTPLAACTLANGTLDAMGHCSSPAAAGFATLDGFSTTAAILAPMSDLVQAATVKPSTVQLYDLSDPTKPVLVPAAHYITEPCEVTSSCTTSTTALSPAVVLQPAGATASDPTSVLRTRPLQEDTDYAVVISTDVMDKAGKPIAPGTAAKILLFDNPLVMDGHSTLTGIDDATASALDTMRLALKPVLALPGVEKSKIAIAYTFRTQSVLKLATQLAAIPYTQPMATAMPSAVTATSARAAFAKYGVDPRYVPSQSIAEILETRITTFNLLDPTSGAFNAMGTASPETVDVLISVPRASKSATCAGALAQLGMLGLRCAPMIVFRHGLGSGRAAMLTVADTFAAQGLVTVAIDAVKHGDRALCAKDAECDQGICTPDPTLAHQGDPAGATPGKCTTKLKKLPVDCPAMGGCPFVPTDGIPIASGNFIISANFFRTRDSFRQDAIDQSQLIRALAFAPMGAPPTGHTVFDHMAAVDHVIIDPTNIGYIGQSLGSVQGALDVAANPRINKAVFNVGGGTAVDVFTNSPAFKPSVDQLLFTLGIESGTAKYLQFLVVAKTILDPAEPINFAGHLQQGTLPNLLPPLGGATDGHIPQAPKKILAQTAYCDQTIPNPFNYLFASNIGVGPLPGMTGFGMGTGTFELFVAAQTDLTDCPVFGGAPLPRAAVNHAFLTEWVVPLDATSSAAVGLTFAAQRDAARFLANDTLPPSIQTPQHP
jgi:hypothetical protein